MIRRRRLVLAGGTCALAGAVVLALSGGGGSAGGGGRRPTAPATRPVPATRPSGGRRTTVVRTSRLAWHLPAAVSREVVLPTAGGRLWVLGGLDAAGATVATSYLLDPSTGGVRPAPALAEATHDAAGTLLGTRALVVGGGAALPAAEVQLAEPDAATSLAPPLAAPRSDDRAVTIGTTAYVVGGYDGTSMDAAVLATTDGRAFHVVASLPVPVRYAALAVVGRSLYVLGGQDAAGVPVATVQRVEPARHRVVVEAGLGQALAASVATTVDGTVYLAGGLVPAPGGTSASSAVYAWAPGRRGLREVATLPVAVANAGAAALGDRLYVVGGEGANGAPVALVQTVEVRVSAARRAGSAGTAPPSR